MTAVVQLDDAAMTIGGRALWTDGTLTIDQGKVVGIVGPNGAGKTTLLKVLLGLAELSSGTVKVFGSPPKRGNPRIGYVAQNRISDIASYVRGIDVIALSAVGSRWWLGRIPPETRAGIRNVVERVGAQEFVRRRLSQLSGGERQRVAIASALVADPDVLLLDEPFSGLDIKAQRSTMNLIDDLHKDGVTVIMVIHDLYQVAGSLDAIIYLYDGHPHYAPIDSDVDPDLLTHLHGTELRTVSTPVGDFYTQLRKKGPRI